MKKQKKTGKCCCDKKTNPVVESELTLPEIENVFSLNEIRSICVRYRLWFLDSTYVKSEFPYEAIVSIMELERKYNQEITSFQIIVPENVFEL